ncbi:carboxypeptidase-like regulatory domain-containing protein [Parapedobacter tibetensis]|uniref:carboxypeptidase-like regulatory domain-containing protein n=1 Tax=Parapedobacter tibetensis TaxID=2972951 RepID=UPI00214DDBA5|nr:carboxypeptidase-like regulatory domain-containing protein [Parapedobacter tibetensis]
MKKHKPDIALIRKYLNGELSPREMYEMERQAQDDPLLMDIIMGMEHGELGEHDANLSDIHKRIEQRVKQGGKKANMVLWWRWGAAASVVFLLAIGGALWLFREQPTPMEERIAQQAPLQKQEETAPDTPAEKATRAPVAAESEVADSPQVLAARPAPKQSEESIPPSADTRLASRKMADTSPTRLAALRPMEQVRLRGVNDTLGEAQVADYMAQKKENAVAYLSAINTPDSPNLTEALTGRVAGVSIRGTKEQPAFTGTVVDRETNEPLAGATIRLRDGSYTIMTDSTGKFTVGREAKAQMEAMMIGYKSRQINLTDNDSLIIGLESDKQTLSEVVVVGYDPIKQKKKAEPRIGWEAYNQYLKDHARSHDDQNGIVKLAFMLDAEGNPINIRIVNGLNDDLDQQAIQLVRDGSTWVLGNDESQEIQLKIRFH